MFFAVVKLGILEDVLLRSEKAGVEKFTHVESSFVKCCRSKASSFLRRSHKD